MTLWIGNAAFPFITSQDYSKEKETIERNFVGHSPQIYEFDSRLEQGTFNLLLMKDNHPENLTLEEQRHMAMSLSEHTPVQNSFKMLQDEGYLSFSNTTTTREPNLMAIDVTADTFYLEDADYQPAYINSPSARASDIGLSENGFLALHPEVESVQLRDPSDGSTTSPSPSFTLDSVDATLDVYSLNGNQLIYENPTDSTAFTLPERESVVEASDSSDSPFFSAYQDFSSASANNGVVKFEMNASSITMYLWDGSWTEIGDLSFNVASPIMDDMDNHSLNVNMDDGDMSIFRGEPFIEFSGTFSSFSLDTSGGDDPISSTSTEGDYAISGAGATYEYFISRDDTNGTFNSTGSTIELNSISNDTNVSVGFVVNSDKTGTIEWSQTDENIERDLLARETL